MQSGRTMANGAIEMKPENNVCGMYAKHIRNSALLLIVFEAILVFCMSDECHRLHLKMNGCCYTSNRIF